MGNSRQKLNVAILGATGNVGRKFLEVLEERGFPINNLRLLSSEKSSGKKIKFKGKEYSVEKATKDSFKGIDLVLASAGGKVSKELAHHAVAAGAVYIDNSSYFRMEKDVPLIVVGVNESEVKKHKGIIANPNCTMAQLAVPLKALQDLAVLKRVIVSSYQSVSGAGKAAIDELTEQTKQYLNSVGAGLPCPKYEAKHVNRKFAFNVIPHIDDFSEGGYTKEELKVMSETRKVLGLPNLRMTCTAVRVPVYVGHSESVNIEFEKPVTREEIIKTLMRFPGIEVVDDPENEKYPMAIDVAGKDPVYVGRIREDNSNPNTFNFWVVADNLRIGAALNAVRIAEELLKQNLVKVPVKG